MKDLDELLLEHEIKCAKEKVVIMNDWLARPEHGCGHDEYFGLKLEIANKKIMINEAAELFRKIMLHTEVPANIRS